MTTINLTGIQNIPGEERTIAYLSINYNGNTYDWSIFIPVNVTDISSYLSSAETISSLEAEIDYKESLWASSPKTRTIPDPIMGDNLVVDIVKEEIVKPDNPDYYALRRAEYPPLAEQLGAIWKGVDSQDYIDIQQKIADVKAKYPKPQYGNKA